MANKDTPTVSPAGGSDPSNVSAAGARLSLLLAKIRDELYQFLDAVQRAISGEGGINWRLLTITIPDPGDGGTLRLPEKGCAVTWSNFGICRSNIPVSEADIDTAARCLQDCDLPHDAQRLGDEFQDLKRAFCSLEDWIQLSDGSAADRKFYARACATALWEHLNDLIGTVDATFSAGGGGQTPAPPQPQYVTIGQIAAVIQRSPRTVEKWKGRSKNPMPPPGIEGGGGKPDEWLWETLRPWLEQESGRQLPERFPMLCSF